MSDKDLFEVFREKVGERKDFENQAEHNLALGIFALGWNSKREEEESRTCEWTQDSGPDFDLWNTSCGNAFTFFDGGPKDNEVHFCNFCGAKVIQVVPDEESE